MSELHAEAPDVNPGDAKAPEPVVEESKSEKPPTANERRAAETQQSQERPEDVRA